MPDALRPVRPIRCSCAAAWNAQYQHPVNNHCKVGTYHANGCLLRIVTNNKIHFADVKTLLAN